MQLYNSVAASSHPEWCGPGGPRRALRVSRSFSTTLIPLRHFSKTSASGLSCLIFVIVLCGYSLGLNQSKTLVTPLTWGIVVHGYSPLMDQFINLGYSRSLTPSKNRVTRQLWISRAIWLLKTLGPIEFLGYLSAKKSLAVEKNLETTRPCQKVSRLTHCQYTRFLSVVKISGFMGQSRLQDTQK